MRSSSSLSPSSSPRVPKWAPRVCLRSLATIVACAGSSADAAAGSSRARFEPLRSRFLNMDASGRVSRRRRRTAAPVPSEVVTHDRYALDGESFYRLSDRQSSSPSRFAAADVVELLAGTERTGMEVEVHAPKMEEVGLPA